MPAPTGPLPAPSDGFTALLHEQRRGVILIAVLSAIVVVLSLILGLRGEWRARQVESQVREGKEAADRQQQRADHPPGRSRAVEPHAVDPRAVDPRAVDPRAVHDNDAPPPGPGR